MEETQYGIESRRGVSTPSFLENMVLTASNSGKADLYKYKLSFCMAVDVWMDMLSDTISIYVIQVAIGTCSFL